MAEGKKTGNVFSEVLGCLILIIAVIAVLVWFILKPKMEEAGYSFAGISEKASNIKDKVSETVRDAADKYKDTKDKVKDKTDEAKENISEKVEEVKD